MLVHSAPEQEGECTGGPDNCGLNHVSRLDRVNLRALSELSKDSYLLYATTEVIYHSLWVLDIAVIEQLTAD